MEELAIRTPFIRLDASLKFQGTVTTGGEAKELIINGKISVNDEVCTARGRKLHPGDRVQGPGFAYEITAENLSPSAET